jgi:hypothetical protein
MAKSRARLLEERDIVDGVVRAVGSAAAPVRRDAAKVERVRSVSVNLAESPLGWLLAHGHLSRRQYEAGERLRFDWERANLDPRVTMRWDFAPSSPRGGGSGGVDLSLAQLDARRRFESATGHAGPGLADILWRVVCAGEGMRDSERALGWPARAGKLVLTFALDRVADHYRIR